MVKRTLVSLLLVVLAALVGASFIAWYGAGLQWWHIAGMGGSLAMLLLIWMWPGRDKAADLPP